MKPARGSLIAGPTGKRKGQQLSGASMGYEVRKSCMANTLKEGYKPCGEPMVYSAKKKTWTCRLHGEMH